MTMRSVVTLLIGIVTTLMLASCASTKYYDETFTSLMVASDRSKVVVLGKHYHYIFDMPEILDKSMRAGFRKNLSGYVIRDFYVSGGGKTWGHFRLQLNKNATEDDIKEAHALGYATTKDGLIYYTIEVSGKRYAANTMDSMDGNASAMLNERYHVRIVDSQAQSDQMSAMSPVIVLGGGLFAIANPAVLLMTLPMTGLKP